MEIFKLVENLDLVEEWNCLAKLDLEDWKELGSMGNVNVEDLDLVDKLDLVVEVVVVVLVVVTVVVVIITSDIVGKVVSISVNLDK